MALAFAGAFAVLLLGGGTAFASSPALSGVTCQLGSGPHLSGAGLTADQVSGRADGTCANLSGADLAGLDLSQLDLANADLANADLHGAQLDQATLSGADLSHANLAGASLTQATLTGADLAYANLTGAQLDQTTAPGVTLTGADLSHANLEQATLTGARLDGADLAGTQFTEAELGGVSFTGVTGLRPWSTYLLIGAVVIFLLLAIPVLVRTFRGRGGVRALAFGLLGSLLVALGLHLSVGGLFGEFSFAFDAAAAAVCRSPQCSVGLNSGVPGLLGGLVAIGVGVALRATAGARSRAGGSRFGLGAGLNY